MKNCVWQWVGKFLSALAWVLGGFCVFPVVWMLSGIFWQDGNFSWIPVAAVFADPGRLAELFARSLEVGAGTVLVALLLGVPAGFLCFRTDLPGRRILIFSCIMAACIPLYVTATCWMALCGMPFWLYRGWGVAWISGLAFVPLVALLTGVIFSASDRDVEDAASLETGAWGVFRHATLPAGAWGIGVAAMVVVILSLWDITVTDILMVRTFAEEVFTQFQLGAGPARAAAVSLPMILFFLVLWLLIRHWIGRKGESAFCGRMPAPQAIELGVWRYPLAIFSGLLVLAFFIVPLLSVVRAVGSAGHFVTAWRTAQQEILGTLSITPIAATISTALAFPAAWVLARRGRAWWMILAALFLLVSVPAPIVGIGLIRVLNRDGIPGMIYDTQAGVILAYLLRALPFAVLVLWPAIRAIPREMEEAAMLDGADGFTRLRRIVLPGCWRALTVAWFLSFILAITDMGASFLVAPPGLATVSTRFFTLIHYGVYPDAAGICLILLGMIGAAALVLAGVVWPVMKRSMA